MNTRIRIRRARSAIGAALVTAVLPAVALPQTLGPSALPRKGATIMRPEGGQPKPGNEALAGSVLVTANQDWKARWNAQGRGSPGFTEASTVARGQKVWALITFSNPGLDRSGQAHIGCDLRMLKPDGKTAVDQKGLSCFDGTLTADQQALYLATQSLEFVGEPADPAGTWRVEVTLHDKVRRVDLPLFAAFTLR